MAVIDSTAVNVALPVLQTTLNATVADVQWIVESYALFLAALILVGGSLGDHFGRRRILPAVLHFCSSLSLVWFVTFGESTDRSAGGSRDRRRFASAG
jgi:MFS family permease